MSGYLRAIKVGSGISDLHIIFAATEQRWQLKPHTFKLQLAWAIRLYMKKKIEKHILPSQTTNTTVN